jgi:hypothetical protein
MNLQLHQWVNKEKEEMKMLDLSPPGHHVPCAFKESFVAHSLHESSLRRQRLSFYLKGG